MAQGNSEYKKPVSELVMSPRIPPAFPPPFSCPPSFSLSLSPSLSFSLSNSRSSLSSDMAELNKVCCMCGDVGFPDKLFRCGRCFSRFQHSYCSSFYEECSSECAKLCDWCRSEERSAARNQSSKNTSTGKERETARGKSKLPPRPAVRRYKLLKDVLC